MRAPWAIALAAASAHAQISPGAQLYLELCETPVPASQTFKTTATTVSAAGGAAGILCATFTSTSTPLVMLPCDGSPSQTWAWGAGTGTFSGQAGSGVPAWWNTQGGDGVEGPGSSVSVWPSSGSPGFNGVFVLGQPGAGQIAEVASSPGNTTFSNLCVTAITPPPPPPLPNATADQDAWEGQGPTFTGVPGGDMAVFIHYNMATAAGTQGCGGCGSTAPPEIDLWAPSALDTDSWIAAGVAMGATRFVYVAKHGCGFAAWNSTTNYPYSAAHSSAANADVVDAFVASARRAGVGFGFYYSVVSNQLCNVCSGVVQPNPGPGQLSVTQEEYDALVIAQLTELWGKYGPLTEAWFDGGYSATLKANLTALASRLQPHIVAFGGVGITASPARWVGTEAGYAPYPCWSTDSVPPSSGAGDPDGAVYNPAETDFTLQNGDQWFYSTEAGVHPPAQLRAMYETSVGHNSPVIIDFAPFPNGSLPAAQVVAAETLGSFIRGCYAVPLAKTSGAGADTMPLVLGPLAAPTTIDRVLVSEALLNPAPGGSRQQLVRSFTLTATLANGTIVNLLPFLGSSIGAKFIVVLPAPLDGVVDVTLNVTAIASQSPPGAPFIRDLSAYACDALAQRLDGEWEAHGFPQPAADWTPREKYVRPWAMHA